MPYQLNWQFVVTKSQGLVHEAGAFAEATGGAFIGMVMSAARASSAYEAPTTPMMIAAKLPGLKRVSPLPNLICMHLVEFALFSWAEWLGDALITSKEWWRMTKIRASCAYATVTPCADLAL
jgi:hypothetical protein